MPWILSGLAILFCVGLSIWLWREKELPVRIGLALIIGGAIGNVIDRLRFKAVIDFLDFYIGSYHWPAFNIADSCICIGVFLIIINSIRKGKKK